MADKNAPQMMDPSILESSRGVDKIPNYRVCYAAQTLVEEIKASFPETLVNAEFSGINGRNVALDVTFDTADIPALAQVLRAVDADPRIEYVIVGNDGALVSFYSSLRTQDSREPFHIASALAILGPVEAQHTMEDGSW